ncbi:amidohydrolase 3 [Rhizodiscina lignyota]|uniref:Amidohydrolase 3 n=1 Tax=Rhizodiscina lignyota TaxID=1504668 RepID=A0A9P4I9P0_9PEZI|nr:amidohydrolase 3 [Rhizodiscina lignyota]
MSLSSASTDNAVAYVNGRVYTINPASPWAEAFIVSPSGTFTVVGSNSSILETAKAEGLVTYDLRDSFVMPGIHDAHMHIHHSGLAQLNEPVIGMDATVKTLAEKLKEGSCACDYAHVHEDWILGHSVGVENYDRSYLDKTFPEIPVIIRTGGGHGMYLNTEALKRAGYDLQNEVETNGKRFLRREDGSLTGEVYETAMAKASLALPKPAVAHVKRAILKALRVAHSVGVTSVQEAGINSIALQALSELENEGLLQTDVATHIVHNVEFLAQEPISELERLIDRANDFKSKHVDTNFVKFAIDGVPLPPLMTQCGLDEHGNIEENKLTMAERDFEETLARYDARGMTIKIHACGAGSVRRSLDAIEKARKKNPTGPRHEVAHCNVVHENDYARFAKLNVTAEMSPAFFFGHPLTQGFKDVLDWDFVKLADAGAHITVGSDWGGFFDPSLIVAGANAVERVGKGSKERGGELLCRYLTLAGAEAVGKQNERGSIEVGKKASFIAVDKDLSKGEFDGASVTKTWFEGNLVWEKPKP